MASDRILQTKQIAAKLGCCTKTVLRHFHAGKLRGAWKFGSATAPVKIRERDLDRLLKKGGR